MAKVKEITTTIEDEVTFMVNPNVEYVSLVKHGANRAPFKVLKAQKTKEEFNMNKVVQSVLVRNDLSEDDITKALEGIDKRSAKEFDSFTAYPQVAIEKVNPESVVVTKHENVEGIYFVLGDLADGASEGGTLMVDAKEAVDYATLDNLYTELYAMADVVGGTMRQENADAEFRKTTILKAIDNFKAFAEVVLESLSAEKLAKAIDPKNHPDLVVDILHAITSPAAATSTDDDDLTDEEKTAKAEAEAKAKEDEEKKAKEAAEAAEADAAAQAASQTDPNFDVVVSRFNEALNTFGDKLIGAIGEVGKEVKASSKTMQEGIEKVSEEVGEVKNTTLAMKAESDEDDPPVEEPEIFKGVLFSK